VAHQANCDADLEAQVRSSARRVFGVDVETLDRIPGQLGLRAFYRATLAAGPLACAIARIDQPEDPAGRPAGAPPEPPLEPIRALYEQQGLPVPKRYGRDDPGGVVWLEDVGDLSLRDASAEASADERAALLAAACDLIPRIQAIAAPAGGVSAFDRHLDEELFAYKAELFSEWVLRNALDSTQPSDRAAVRDAFALAARAAAEAPQRLAHRDYQSANLHVVPGRGLVMIDLQGAFLAPPEYDLMCLLRDSYLDVSEDDCARECDRIRPLLPDAPEPDEFARRFDLLTLARKGKDLARFFYAASERGDDRYLRYVGPTLATLRGASERAAARDPEIAPFASLCRRIRETPCAR
jgi:aminoglycoside/choline kinase family phosphotransferase